MDLLRYADEHKPDLSSLRTVVCGGAAVPRVADARVRGAPRREDHAGLGDDRDQPARRGRAAARRTPRARSTGATARMTGRIVPLVDVRLMGDDGEVAPWDGESTGEVEIRGPWIASRLLRGPVRRRQVPRRLAAHGRHRLDRLARVHADHRPREGPDQVRRRVDLLGRARERADVAPGRDGGGGDRQARRALDRAPAGLRGLQGGREPDAGGPPRAPRAAVAKWWLPDEFAFIEAVPKTSVGKFDKKVLRAQLGGRSARDGAQARARRLVGGPQVQSRPLPAGPVAARHAAKPLRYQ